MAKSDKILLVYDKECPACHFYCQQVEMEENAGSLELIDAREESTVMDEITQQGLDIDQGMVLKKDDSFYYGADAINELAKMSPRKGGFNRMNALLFRSKRISQILYPCLKFVRNMLLKILRKTKINNLGNKNSTHFLMD